ncbi:hypothetical protein SAMN05421751_10135 [Jhaorihella thermophila]|uniref:Uncharacterized protein n=1 Tax=Jhaorihella thermophila TaxID=488547 RepID=A0A1H5RMB6_9RHOB|nr:hypothetical protein SAMN05421751_10135 [Jhaorihella thermophila]
MGVARLPLAFPALRPLDGKNLAGALAMNSVNSLCRTALVWIAAGMVACAPSASAEEVTGSSSAELAERNADLPHPAARFGFGQGSFIAAPIPFKSPLIGNGLALGGGYVFRSDEESKSSHLALGVSRPTMAVSAMAFRHRSRWSRTAGRPACFWATLT